MHLRVCGQATDCKVQNPPFLVTYVLNACGTQVLELTLVIIRAFVHTLTLLLDKVLLSALVLSKSFHGN
jgi:hypothetical protein